MLKKLKNYDPGFTIIELVLTIAIILILSSLVIGNMRNFIAEKRVEKEVVTMWKEMCALRSKALKKEKCYFVAFNPHVDTSYKIYKDKDNDSILDAGEDITSPFRAKVTFGLANGVTTGPDGTVAAAPIEGDWESANLGYMRILNDYLGSINTGRIFLKSPSLPKIGFCIEVRSGSQNIRLFRWKGSQWNEM